MQLGYESGWMAYTSIVLLAFCTVRLFNVLLSMICPAHMSEVFDW